MDTKRYARFDRPGHAVTGDRSRQSRGAGYEYSHAIVDDHSRLAYAEILDSQDAAAVVAFTERALDFFAANGITVKRLMTDNAWAYTRSGKFKRLLRRRGIKHKRIRPRRPQTNGKVERFHQTLKKFLRKQPPATSIAQLQAQVDRFVAYYNDVRPHRAKGRKTPRSAFDSRDKARPLKRSPIYNREVRVRHDKVDKDGSVTIRYMSKLHHIGMGRANKGTKIILLVVGRHVRIIDRQGKLLRDFELDPSRDYQPIGLG